MGLARRGRAETRLAVCLRHALMLDREKHKRVPMRHTAKRRIGRTRQWTRAHLVVGSAAFLGRCSGAGRRPGHVLRHQEHERSKRARLCNKGVHRLLGCRLGVRRRDAADSELAPVAAVDSLRRSVGALRSVVEQHAGPDSARGSRASESGAGIKGRDS